MPQHPDQPGFDLHGSDRQGMASVVQRNIHELAEIRRREDARKGVSERAADAVTRFAGSMAFVYVHAVLYGGWLLVNAGVVPVVEPWDPFPFVMLAMAASVEAIFLSTFILISQNRMQRLADRRAELDLQISLLTEHELTRAIQLLDEVARRLDVPRPAEHEMREIKQDVQPARVARAIEQAEGQAETGGA